MQQFKIENGIPIPDRFANVRKALLNQARGLMFPFDQLQVGQSFLVRCGAHPKVKALKRENVRYHMVNYMKKNKPQQFTLRVVSGGVRVWRIDDTIEDLSWKGDGKKMRLPEQFSIPCVAQAPAEYKREGDPCDGADCSVCSCSN